MKRAFLVVSLVVLVLLAPACRPTAEPEAVEKVVTKESEVVGTATPEPAPPSTERERTLIVAYSMEPSTIDPSTYYEVEANAVLMGVYESLTRYVGDESKITPWLAESWEVSDDAKTYIFHLQQGVTFHNGEPFNAEAVKFNVERTIDINEGPGWLLADFVDSVEVIDDYTVAFHLKAPTPSFIHNVTGNWALKFMCPGAVKEHATEDDLWAYNWFKEHACGTGPYKLMEWSHNNRFLAEKFDGYWGGWEGQHFDTIIERIIPESSTQRLLLEKGDIDMTGMPLTLEDVLAIQKEPGVSCEFHATPLLWNCTVFTQRAPLDKREVRQALLYAFNYEAVANEILGGIKGSVVKGTLFSPSFEGYSPDQIQYTFDLGKAKELLAQAGYPDGGFSLTLRYLEGWDDFRRIAEMYQADLATLGITLDIGPLPAATMFELGADKDQIPDLNMSPLMPDNANTYSWLWGQAHSGAIPPVALNRAWYSNPEFDKLLDAAKEELDAGRRAEIYRDAARMMTEDAITIWVAQVNDILCARDDIQGRNYNQWYIYTYWPYDLYRSK